ncbi:MAG: LCP family protein, partial [Clostridia bacterium]|nr:LCP family protein [Clostridia bacterium]
MKTSVRNFIITFFASLLIFGVAAYFISSFVSTTLTESFENSPAISLDIITAESDTADSPNNIPDVFDSIKGESFDFVIIGTDYQPELLDDYNVEDKYTDGFPKERNREYEADAVAVVRFDKEGKRILISTIPTSMRLEVNGLVTTLGDVYRENGLEYFLDKLTALTGFELDKYFVIDVNDFAGLINTIGGVNFNVPENMSYSDPEQELEIELKKGSQYINGDKAEQLLRFNDYVSSDNSRAKTTAQFMLAVADKLADASFIEKATSYFSAFKK